MKKPQIPGFSLVRVCAAVLFFALAAAAWQGSAQANQDIDLASGQGQQFTGGYAGRSFGEGFHHEQAYGEVKPSFSENWRWDKSIQASTTYEANVLGSAHDPKDDLIYTFGLPVKVSRKGSAGFLGLFYQIQSVRYVENHKFNRINHQMGTEMETKVGKWKIRFKDTFVPSTAVAAGERNELKSAESTRVTTLTNSADLSAVYQYSPKTQFSIDWRHDVFYIPNVADNSAAVQNFSTLTHTITPSVSYLLTPKTKLHLDYSGAFTDYFVGGGDYDTVQSLITAGIAGKLSAKTGYTLDLSAENREYKHIAADENWGYILKAAIARKITEKVTSTLSWRRDTLAESVDVTRPTFFFKSDDFQLSTTWFLTPKLTFDGDISAGFVNRDGLVTQVDPDNPTLTFTRQDNTEFFQWDLLLKWQPRPFLSTVLGYYCFKKNGAFKQNEFDNHRFVGSLEYKF